MQCNRHLLQTYLDFDRAQNMLIGQMFLKVRLQNFKAPHGRQSTDHYFSTKWKRIATIVFCLEIVAEAVAWFSAICQRIVHPLAKIEMHHP